MRTRVVRVLLSLVALAGLSTAAVAQTALTTTTLSAALNDTVNRVTVASATGVAVGSYLFVDREAMLVQALNGTTAEVVRGFAGTAARAHVASSTVYVGTPQQFYASEAGGACTATAELVTPRIVLPTGNVYTCTGGFWNRVGADNGVIYVSHSAAAAADVVNQAVFVADRDYVLVGVRAIWETASTSGTLQITKATGTTACGSGTSLMASTINLAGTANTVNTGTLTATAANLLIASGNRLCLSVGGTLTNQAGLGVQLALVPR